jgi:two-component system phosphate regulon sensor histidine kinase PhoR
VIKLKISQKLLLMLLLVALLPLGAVNLYWFRSAQSSLRSAAINQQVVLTTSAVYRVNQYMTDKINALIIHSQVPSVQSFDVANANRDLSSLIEQDNDIQTLVLADVGGTVHVAMNRQGPLPTGSNIANQDAFRAATFLAGKEYISPVTFDAQHQPIVTIAAPLVVFATGQNLSTLSTAQGNIIRTQQDIKGTLIATVNLNSLWQSVLSQAIGTQGYAYVVDSQGALIAYPNTDFLATHHNLSKSPSVAAFLTNPTAAPHPMVTTSETGVPVLSSYQQVTRTSWGVITQEPLTTIFATANHVGAVGIGMFAVVALVVMAVSYLASRQLTVPIRRLVTGASLISEGQLDARITNHSNDEIGTLSRTFNTMASSLAAILQRATAESSKVSVIINNASEGIVAVDATGRILLANIAAAVLIGEVPKNIVGQPVADLYHWTSEGKLFTPSLTEVQVYQELTLTNLNNRVHFVDLLVNPIRDDPTGIHAILTIFDKTGERELENMKVDFVSMAAHELRTPITTIRGYLDLIVHDDTLALPADTRNYFEHIESGSAQLVGLINNLLNVSRIERGMFTLKLEKLDWTALVQSCIADQQFTAKIKSISLTYEGPRHSIYILADQIAASEVINNLLSNALNYTPNAGHVTLRVAETDKGIVTAVADDGIGIPPSGLEHLFTKFFRVRSGLTSGSGGTGLGLFISKSIVDLHKGTITVESVEGQGSTFTVTLPKFDQEQYNELITLRPGTLNRRHGWIKKNTTRRG